MSFLALWLCVGLLGGVGAIARFLLDGMIAARSRRLFPIGTLAVNLSGTVLLGLLVGVALQGNGYLLAGTATIGSYTTFSTWMFESQRGAEDGYAWMPAANVVLSLALGVGAAAIGKAVG